MISEPNIDNHASWESIYAAKNFDHGCNRLVYRCFAKYKLRREYTKNYSDWKSIAQSAKYWYVLGLFDMTLIAISGDKNTEAVRDGMLKCGPELNYFTAVNAISKYYESNTAHWSDPPYLAFWQTVVRGECLTHVNAARVEAGLMAWTKR